jgi:hypothetical protein
LIGRWCFVCLAGFKTTKTHVEGSQRKEIALMGRKSDNREREQTKKNESDATGEGRDWKKKKK